MLELLKWQLHWQDKMPTLNKECKNYWGSKCVPLVHDWLVLALGWAKLHLLYQCESLVLRPESVVSIQYIEYTVVLLVLTLIIKAHREPLSVIQSPYYHSSQQLFSPPWPCVRGYACWCVSISVLICTLCLWQMERLSSSVFQAFRWRGASFEVSFFLWMTRTENNYNHVVQQKSKKEKEKTSSQLITGLRKITEH